ncbi:MAG: hypothetical protein KF893_08195 [Caldilineaceae bacterium]|nr:hypothetical protein [Caldilineaceae bacterium]
MADRHRMPSTSTPSTLAAAHQLLHDLFGDQPSLLSIPFADWVTTSKPFLAFAQTYQSKIRKKIRTCQTLEETYNLYCELRTAYLLLQEPKFALAYESAGKEGRSADFAVTFRTHTTFHVEVTRLRASQQEQQFHAGAGSLDLSTQAEQIDFLRRYESRRLADAVCDKIEQLSPATPNLLWIWSESRLLHEFDVEQGMLGLKRSIEQREAPLFSRYGYEKPADFIRYYQRLSAMLIQSLSDQGMQPSFVWWQNKDIRHPFPSKVTNLLHSCIQSDASQAFPREN